MLFKAYFSDLEGKKRYSKGRIKSDKWRVKLDLPSIDLHTHSVYSDGKNCIRDMIRQAETNGLDAVAITDHYHKIGNLSQYVNEIKEEAENFSIRVLVGVEIHPIEDFTLPVVGKRTHGIDLILADPLGEASSYLNQLDKERILEYFAKMYKSICENPEVDIIAHPLNLGRFEEIRSFSDIDPWLLEHIIKEARKGGKFLEVMSGMSWWYPRSRVDLFTREYSAFIKEALDGGVKFSIGSDAHCVHGVGNISWSRKVLWEVGATRNDIINVELY